uniref:Uncharacterized protein n=1 Tax=Nelumbo nucifera TaxID=4432 RepID=A0A822XD72_NELNU|nr:TPA_asm: hypothetical protein HUJ06_020847 [Nelumbo nucifera]
MQTYVGGVAAGLSCNGGGWNEVDGEEQERERKVGGVPAGSNVCLLLFIYTRVGFSATTIPGTPK